MTPKSQNHLAELLGLSRSTCSDLVKRGMPSDSLEAAQAWRESNLDPARRKDGPRVHDYRTEDAHARTESFDEARTRDKVAEANLREMTAAKRRGELIEVAAIKAVLSTDYATTRDTLLQIPARMAPLLAAEKDPAAVQTLLHAEIHQALMTFAGAADHVPTIEGAFE
jgi:phage terminase Nu1 subunit (DNA packaging protein)